MLSKVRGKHVNNAYGCIEYGILIGFEAMDCKYGTCLFVRVIRNLSD